MAGTIWLCGALLSLTALARLCSRRAARVTAGTGLQLLRLFQSLAQQLGENRAAEGVPCPLHHLPHA